MGCREAHQRVARRIELAARFGSALLIHLRGEGDQQRGQQRCDDHQPDGEFDQREALRSGAVESMRLARDQGHGVTTATAVGEEPTSTQYAKSSCVEVAARSLR